MHFIPTFCSILLYPFLLVSLSVVFLLNELIRGIVNLVLRYKYGHKVKLISVGNDASYSGQTGPGLSPITIITHIIEPGKLTEQKIKDTVTNSLLAYKDDQGNRVNDRLENIFTIKYGYPCWKKDENFHVDNHVRTVDEIITDKSEKIWLSRLWKNMDESKPQWEFILFPQFVGK